MQFMTLSFFHEGCHITAIQVHVHHHSSLESEHKHHTSGFKDNHSSTPSPPPPLLCSVEVVHVL